MAGRADPGDGRTMSEAEEAARLDALRAAAETGWKDIDEGRYRDVEFADENEDARAFDEAMAEERENIPWEQVKRDLGW